MHGWITDHNTVACAGTCTLAPACQPLPLPRATTTQPALPANLPSLPAAAHQAAACIIILRERQWHPQLRLHRVRVGGDSADALYESDQLHYKLKAAHVVPDHLLPEPAA